MATGMPPMSGPPPQMPPQGGSPLGALGKKPSTPDSGAPLLQMIMSLLAGAGLKDFSSSLSNLVKTLKGGPDATHHKASGAPPGMQPSRPGMPPAGPQGAPPAVSGPMPPPGAGAPPGGPQGGSIPPELLQKLLAMLTGGGQGGPPQQ